MKLRSICFVMRRYDDFIHSESMMDLIHRQYQWTSHLIDSGVKIYHIHGSDIEESTETSVGRIYFVKDRNRTSILSHSSHFYKNAAKKIDNLNPSLVIYHGLADGLSHYLLRKLTRIKTYQLIQDHGNVYKSKFKLYQFFFKPFDAILFNSLGQEVNWIRNGVFKENQIYHIPEGTSNFSINIDKRLSHLQTKKRTECLWVGNLDENKDPLTIIKAIKIIKENNPIHLSMIYRQDKMLESVKTLIADNQLEDCITLVGAVNHDELETYYINSHFILAGSAKEGSGYAMMEAMSCGVVPVMTKIPSFIHFSDNGNAGLLYSRKNHQELAKVLSKSISQDYHALSKQTRRFFEEELSGQAIATKFDLLYAKLTNNSI